MKLSSYNQNFYSFSLAIFISGFILGPAILEISSLLILIYLLIMKIKDKEFFIDDFKFEFFLIFFLWIFFSSAINFFENANYNNYKGFYYLRFIIFIYVIINFLKYFKNFTLLKNIILISLYFIIFDTFVQFINGKNLFGYPAQENGRLSGILFDEYILGSLILKLLLILNILYFKIFQDEKKILLKEILCINFLSFIAISITLERSSTILIVVYFILTIFFLKYDLKKKIMFFTSICLLLISIISINNGLKQKFIDSYNLLINLNGNKNKVSEISIPGYFAHFYSATEIFLKNPIIGSGIRSFRNECKKFEEVQTELKSFVKNKIFKNKKIGNFEKNICTTHPHQYFFEIISEIGIVGLLIYLLLILKLFKTSNKVFYPIIIICFLPLIPTGSFFNNYNAYFIWFIFCLIFIIGNTKNENN